MTLELLPGDLILVRGTSTLAHAIESVEHSPYSHVAGYVGDGKLIEAQGFRRTGYIDASEYAGCADVYRFVYPLPIKVRNHIVELAKENVGGHYDYLLILWELSRYLFHLALPFKEAKGMRICSTLWAIGIYKKAGIDLCKGIAYPSPADLAASMYLKRVGSL